VWTKTDGQEAGKRWAEAVLVPIPGSPVRLDIDMASTPDESRRTWLIGFAQGVHSAIPTGA
jgi:hypothetical protein